MFMPWATCSLFSFQSFTLEELWKADCYTLADSEELVSLAPERMRLLSTGLRRACFLSLSFCRPGALTEFRDFDFPQWTLDIPWQWEDYALASLARALRSMFLSMLESVIATFRTGQLRTTPFRGELGRACVLSIGLRRECVSLALNSGEFVSLA